jgi:hypothetical protein
MGVREENGQSNSENHISPVAEVFLFGKVLDDLVPFHMMVRDKAGEVSFAFQALKMVPALQV